MSAGAGQLRRSFGEKEIIVLDSHLCVSVATKILPNVNVLAPQSSPPVLLGPAPLRLQFTTTVSIWPIARLLAIKAVLLRTVTPS